MRKLYCFDFDGTLTKEDTMFSFLKFYNPKRFYLQFIKHLPLFIMLKLKLANAEQIKKSFISSILKGETQENIQLKSQQFFNQNYPKIFRENALDFIKNIDKQRTKCYIVTASLDIWVRPFAEHFDMELIATQAQFKNEIYTGEFISKNCNGPEKVNRLKKIIHKEDYDKIISFGDTQGDKEMLEWADESHYRFFH